MRETSAVRSQHTRARACSGARKRRRRDRRQAQPNGEPLRTWSGKQVSVRQRGGWSEGTAEKELALHNCVELVRRAVQETLKGDEEWGVLLGEMIPYLTKRGKELEKSDAFKARFATIKSSQRARKKGPNERSITEEIIHEATQKHRLLSLAGDLPKSCAKYNGCDLSQLPELYSSSADQWFEEVIWPEWKRRKNKGRLPRQIMDLKKANRITGKRSGKFQLSDLKERVRNTVRRLAKAPQLYYFPEGSAPN